MRKIRLFIAGTHTTKAGSFTFSNEDIKEIYRLSTENPNEKIPFVFGHPQNDLPILGWIERGKIHLNTEGDKTAIVFERKDADFAEESLDILRQMKNDKISVKLDDKVITHIGLVKNAAVKENNNQTFSSENHSGVLCFSEDFQIEDPKPTIEEKVKEYINQSINKIKNFSNMDDSKKIAELEAKIAAFEAKEKEAKEDSKVKALEARIAAFEAAEKETLKTDLKAKVEALKLDETGSKEKMTFGESLLEKDTTLFKNWLNDLKPQVVVQKGSVTAQFSADKGGEEKPSVKDEIQAEYEALKKK